MRNMKFNNIVLSLTDDNMDTLIEDKSKEGLAIAVNNLFIASLYERGEEFCNHAKTIPGGILPLYADVLKAGCDFHKDGTMVVKQNGRTIPLKMYMIKNYFEGILLKIQLDEGLDSAINFMDKNIEEAKEIKDQQRRDGNLREKHELPKSPFKVN